MQDWWDEGQKEYRVGCRTGGIQGRRDAVQVRSGQFRTGRMQDRWDAGQVGCWTGRRQDR